MQEVVLQTTELTKRYGSKTVLDGVSMTVKKGDIYGFVGRNGAGKTTLMRILSGLAFASSGEYCLLGANGSSGEICAARRKTRVMVETATLYMSMTAKQNMQAQCILLGEDESCIDGLLVDVGLDPTLKRPVKNYSLGMRQRLAIAIAMIGEPELLILDEPTNGLDPEGIYQVRLVLQNLVKNRGVTVLVSSHILSELSRLATCYGFIEKGKLVKEISAEELEKECGGMVHLKVSNNIAAYSALQNVGITVANMTQDAVEFADETQMQAALAALDEAGVEVLAAERRGGDLEEYFMNLVGGKYARS